MMSFRLVSIFAFLFLSAVTISSYIEKKEYTVIDVGASRGDDIGHLLINATDLPMLVSQGVSLKEAESGSYGDCYYPQISESGEYKYDIEGRASNKWYVLADCNGNVIHEFSKQYFGFGDVVAIMGQSEIGRMFINYYDGFNFSGGSGRVLFSGNHWIFGNISFLDRSILSTTSMRRMADTWVQNAPSDRVINIVFLAKSGASRVDLGSNSLVGWSWDAFRSVINHVQKFGSDIGLVIEMWYAADAFRQDQWELIFSPLYTGFNMNGTAFNLGSKWIDGLTLDGFLWDLTGEGRGAFSDRTKLKVLIPHRFDSHRASVDFLTFEKGETDSRALFMQNFRDKNYFNFFGSESILIDIDSEMITMFNYENGVISGTAEEGYSWRDISHPSMESDRGSHRLATYLAISILNSLGQIDIRIPRLIGACYNGENIKVLWSHEGITTERLMGPGSAASTGRVIGFEIEGIGPVDGYIENNNTYIDVEKYGVIDIIGSLIYWGRGSGSLSVSPIKDAVDHSFMDMPLVPGSDQGLRGIMGLLPQPNIHGVPITHCG